MLNEYRKQEIIDLAEYVAASYWKGQSLDVEAIARGNQITFSYGDYGQSFDGLLEHRFGHFHIYINLTRLKEPDSPRGRFTFGHELGHFYIDEHRNALAAGIPAHASFNRTEQTNEAEREADFFSSCLLMPSSHFRRACMTRPLSAATIQHLASTFGTSISATIYRYFELDMFPMAMIKTKNGIVQWARNTEGFKYRYWLPKKNTPVPPNSNAAEYFEKGTKYDKEDELRPDDWFNGDEVDRDEPMYELSYPNRDTVLSLVWRKHG
ncbi:MAG: ImmA/IrrE family metallo-endopeptidase [Flavobacteriales bacterium]|nr:ImmA/IrrE family metallo-endopeptidase [Flavobacteriales bacterium]